MATGDGGFDAPLHVANLAVGSYMVKAKCGVTQYATLDVVLASAVSNDTSTVVIIVLFVLIGTSLYWRRMSSN